MSKTEGIAKLYYETKKINWETARINMQIDITTTGYFCGLYKKQDLDLEGTLTHNLPDKEHKKCSVCILIREMNQSISKQLEQLCEEMKSSLCKYTASRTLKNSDKKNRTENTGIYSKDRKILNNMLRDNKRARVEEFTRKIKKDVNTMFKPFKNKENQAIKALRNEN